MPTDWAPSTATKSTPRDRAIATISLIGPLGHDLGALASVAAAFYGLAAVVGFFALAIFLPMRDLTLMAK